MTRREKHMTVLDLVGDFLEDGFKPLRIAGVTLGAHELHEAVRWVRGHDDTKGAPDGAPAWWAQVISSLRADRREERDER